MRETWTENGTAHVLDILTDNNSKPYALIYDGTTYYYVLNQQGDVIRLVDGNGATYANYSYNAWGEPVRVYLDNGSEITAADHIANLNPIRYRGYYYDTETGFYYIGSRYYDPVLCRFVNADSADLLTDSQGGVTDKNLFAYCDNNPVMRHDGDGEFWNTVIGAAAGALIGGLSAAVMGTSIKAGVVSGAISGAVGGAAVDIAIATGGAGLALFSFVSCASGIGSGCASYINQKMNGAKKIDWLNVGVDAGMGVISGVLSFGIADIGGAACQTLKQTMSQPLKKIVKQAGYDFAMTSVISFGSWYNSTRITSAGKSSSSTKKSGKNTERQSRRARAAAVYRKRYGGRR